MRRKFKFLTAMTLALLLVFLSPVSAFAENNNWIKLHTGGYSFSTVYVHVNGEMVEMTSQGDHFNVTDGKDYVNPVVTGFTIDGFFYTIGPDGPVQPGVEAGGTINYWFIGPQVGKIIISKTVTSDYEVPIPNQSFDFTLTNGDDVTESFSLTGGGSAEFILPYGTYTITEDSEQNFSTDDSPTMVYLGGEDGTTVNVSFVNKYTPPMGSITISKSVTSDYEVDIPNQVFNFTITDGDEFTDNFSLTAGGPSKVYTGLLYGTYTITEEAVTNFSTEDSPTVVDLGGQDGVDVTVTIVNKYTPPEDPTGSITISKSVTTEYDVEIPGQVFNFTIADDDEFSDTFSLTAGGPAKVYTGLPYGTYTITEAAVDNFSTEDSPTIIDLGGEDGVDVTVDIVNDYTPPMGSITISKSVTSEYDVDIPEQIFNFTITDGDEFTDNFSLTAGGPSKVYTGLLYGTYTITEEAVTNFSTEDSPTVVDLGGEDGVEVTVNIVNEYTPPEDPKGSLTIVKEVWAEGSYPESTFTFEITMPDQSTDTVQIVNEGNVVINDLDEGMYIVEEIGYPEGFEPQVSSYQVMIGGDGGLNHTVTFINEYTPATTAPPTTPPPTTPPPTTPPPTTAPPTTAPPTTAPPTTAPPETTQPPTTVIEGTVTVHYVDTEGNDLAPQLTIFGEVGGNYSTIEISIEDYILVGFPSNASGLFTVEPIDVFYVYSTGVEPLTLETEPVPLAAPEPEPEEEIVLEEEIPLGDALPQTGQLPPEMFYGIGSVMSLIGISLKRRKKE